MQIESVRVSVYIKLTEEAQYVTASWRESDPDLLVQSLYLSQQLPTPEDIWLHGFAVDETGAVTGTSACSFAPVAKLPAGILRELKERGVVQSRIGTVKRHRSSEAHKQAALG